MKNEIVVVSCIMFIVLVALILSFIPTADERRAARIDVVEAPIMSAWTIIADDVPYNQIIRIHDDEKNVTCWIVSRNGTAMDCIPDNEITR